jgi:crotonobetainyl-CoA:carnitine CoA-transferase CaiB-like acyl-CoA transferase
MTTAGLFAGIRVLDVRTGYAAPITAMLLGDVGATCSNAATCWWRISGRA